MVSENIRMALRSMASSKMRTFLSLLGIVIGVASVVAIMNLGRSAAVSMSASFDAGGLNTITIRPRGNARETMVFTEDFCKSPKVFTEDFSSIEYFSRLLFTLLATSSIGILPFSPQFRL